MTNLELKIMKLNNDLQINKLDIELLGNKKEENKKLQLGTKILDDDIRLLELANKDLVVEIQRYSNI